MIFAEVTQITPFSMQVCVPAEWSDAEVIDFAEIENPCGTENGWAIRKQGHRLLYGDPERTPCNRTIGNVHIVLDA